MRDRAIERRSDARPPAAGGLALATLSALAAVLAAAFFRALPLLANRFHPDEALYAYFGRLIASGRDPLLAQVVVDKPPLAFYLLAGSFGLFGSGEFAARLPTYFASLLNIALLFALARRLYGPRPAALAAWLLALSPFAILFSVTLFIDPLLTACGLWGMWMAAAGRPRPAALALALGFLVKQTAVIFLPFAQAEGAPSGLGGAPGIGLGLALLVAVFSFAADPNPDGLERVAEDTGFLETALEPFYNIFPDYTLPFIQDPLISGILAVVVGTLIVFGAAFLLARAQGKKAEVR